MWVTLRFCYVINVGFDQMCLFCGTFCVSSDKCMSIIVKIKCMNFDNMSNIYGKLKFNIKYIKFITTDTTFIKNYTHLIIFYTHGRTVP
jgi:hypothetical protein